MNKFIRLIIDDIKSNIIYSAAVLLLLTGFTVYGYRGAKFFSDSGVQKNAGYNGPIPHSGYGGRFYHK